MNYAGDLMRCLCVFSLRPTVKLFLVFLFCVVYSFKVFVSIIRNCKECIYLASQFEGTYS